MKTNKQKTGIFKSQSKENYQASLRLEGITCNKNDSNKTISELKTKYAR